MKLYTCTGAPNPRRVAVFLAEKGIEVPTRWVSLRDGEQYSAELAELNPDHTLPFVVLDDGTVISESIAVCRYLEATHPAPALFGTDATEKGVVEMWLRRLEIQGYLTVQDAYRNSRSGFAGSALPGYKEGLPQIPELIERSNSVYRRTLGRLDAILADRDFIAGATFSMADILGHTTLAFAKRTKMDAAADLSPWPNLRAWDERIQSRPSSSAGLSKPE